jgi:hypothetical protein
VIRGSVAIARQVVTRQPRLFVLALAGTIAIAAAMLLPIDAGPQWRWLLNAAHVPGFFLATLLWVTLFERAGVAFWLTCAAALLIGGAFALGTEVMQYFVPYRWPDRRDLALDMAGVLAALLVYAGYAWRTRERDA